MKNSSNLSFKTLHDEESEFKKDLASGFSQKNKMIPSKYFYDERGSVLFNEITRHQDYYLTHCELEILNQYKGHLSQLLGLQSFNLIELGPGEGIKTKLLIEQFIQDHIAFTYIPIDISKEYLQVIMHQLNFQFPTLQLNPLHADYFDGLKWLNINSKQKNVLLFLGSSIGNFTPRETKIFLKRINRLLHPGDYLLIGFDLRKDFNTLIRAYKDEAGLTRSFNLNLLQRINRELNANFDINKFDHYATYNVQSGAMESYLVSLETQTVHIPALNHTYDFSPHETIHVEYSYKYLLSQIEEIANLTHFKMIETFTDSRQYFVDTLWQIK